MKRSPSTGRRYRVRAVHTEISGQLPVATFARGLALDAASRLLRSAGHAELASDLEALHDDAAREIVEDQLRRLSPYDADRVPTLERAVAALTHVAAEHGGIRIEGWAALDLPSLAVILNACARAGSKRDIDVSFDSRALDLPFESAAARSAARSRMGAMGVMFGLVLGDNRNASDHSVTIERGSSAREILLRNDAVALEVSACDAAGAAVRALVTAWTGRGDQVLDALGCVAVAPRSGESADDARLRGLTLSLVHAVKRRGPVASRDAARLLRDAAAELLLGPDIGPDAHLELGWAFNALALSEVSEGITDKSRRRFISACDDLALAIDHARAAVGDLSEVLRVNLLNNASKLLESVSGAHASLEVLSPIACGEVAAVDYKRSLLFLRLGDLDAAYASLQVAEGSAPRDHWAWGVSIAGARAVCLARKGNTGRARDVAEGGAWEASARGATRIAARMSELAALVARDGGAESARPDPKLAPYIGIYDGLDPGSVSFDDRLYATPQRSYT